MKIVRRHLDERRDVRPDDPAEVGVLLAHLGGPADEGDIERFTLDLWSHPSLAAWPGVGPLRRRAARRAWRRHGAELRRRYDWIGGRSPVVDLLESVALGAENLLLGRSLASPRGGGRVRVLVGTLHARPAFAEAAAAFARAGVARVLVRTLYGLRDPATFGACAAAAEEALRSAGGEVLVLPPLLEVEPFAQLLAERVRRALDLVPPDRRDEARILLVAHSPPAARARRCSLRARVEECARDLRERLGVEDRRFCLAWQGFEGPGTAPSPSAGDLAERLAAAGVDALVVVPLSFVVDGYETLVDLDIELYRRATEAGVRQFRRVPSPNAEPDFVAALAREVAAAAEPPFARR